jgi:hypothetical protein
MWALGLSRQAVHRLYIFGVLSNELGPIGNFGKADVEEMNHRRTLPYRGIEIDDGQTSPVIFLGPETTAVFTIL